MKRVFWIAGEKSGDLHASQVLKSLSETSPEYIHFGIGGPHMEEYGFKPIFPFQRFAVMGFVEVLKHLSFFLKVEKDIETLFSSDPPDLLVLVDYPGLNMRVAKLAKRFRIPVLYFICPQFWAWKEKRLHDLAEFTDHVAYILPFEGKFLEAHKIKATYVGHPIAEEIEVKSSRSEFAEKYSLSSDKKWLGFLPGSRDNEIRKMLPVFLKAMSKFNPENYQFLISCSDSVSPDLFNALLKRYPVKNLKIIRQDNYSMMKFCDFIVSTSGTATLETAYLGTPFLIAYKAAPLTYQLGKKFVRINRIGLPNIILNKDLAPELIQQDAKAESIYQKTVELISDKKKYNSFKNDLKELHTLLGNRSAARNTASLIIELLETKKTNKKKKRKKRSRMITKKIIDPVIFFLEKYLAALFILILGSTYRFKLKNHKPRGRVIYAFWHRNLLPLAYLHKFENAVVLVSSSKDGQFIAGPLEALGFKTARGSSSRGGSKAVRQMVKISKDHSLAFTPDGPKGPAKRIKEGLLLTAYLTKLPVVLIAVDIAHEKVFNSWDKFRLPHPFTKINICFSQPIFINSKDDFDEKVIELEREFKLLEYRNKIK